MKNVLLLLLAIMPMFFSPTEKIMSLFDNYSEDGNGIVRVYHSMEWGNYIWDIKGDELTDQNHYKSLVVITIEDVVDGVRVIFKHMDGSNITVIITGSTTEMIVKTDEDGVFEEYNFYAYDNEGDLMTLIVRDYYGEQIPLNQRVDRIEFYLDYTEFTAIAYYITTSKAKFIHEY